MKHKCLGIFLAVMFVLLFLTAFLIFNFKNTLLNVNFIKAEFNKVNLYSELSNATPQIIDEMEKNETDPQAKTQYEKFRIIAKNSITAEWLKTEVEKNLNHLFNWFNNKEKNLQIEISLISLKSEMNKNNILTTNIPDIWIINKDTTGNSPVQINFPSSPSKFFIILNIIFYISLSLSLILLTIIGIMARGSLRSLFRWIGIPILISSVLIGITFLIGKLGIHLMPNLSSLLSDNPSESIVSLYKIIDLLGRNLVLDIFNKKLIESLFIFGFSVIMIVISFFFKNKEEIQIPKT